MDPEPSRGRRALATIIGLSAVAFSAWAIWVAVGDSGLNRPAAPVGTTSTTEAPDIMGHLGLEPAEDDPGWRCEIHGNRRCGSTTTTGGSR